MAFVFDIPTRLYERLRNEAIRRRVDDEDLVCVLISMGLNQVKNMDPAEFAEARAALWELKVAAE